MMAERGLSVDHVTIWRWVQRYAPVLNQRIRRELRRPNRSWRVDETYVKVAGSWTYLYRAIGRRDDRVHAVAQARPDGGDIVSAARVKRWRTAAGSDQRGRASSLRQCGRRFEADRRTRTPLSLPDRALSEQHHRAGSSVHQEADFGEPRLPFCGRSAAHD